MASPVKNYVCQLNEEQIVRLKNLLTERGWEFSDVPYAHFRAAYDHVGVVAYRSGKVTVQGAGTQEFMEFIMEPEILGDLSFTLRKDPEEQELDTRPHIGVDESGKGDFFGPLVVAACYTDESSCAELLKLKVRDSKAIKSDAEIARIAERIRQVLRGNFCVLALTPDKYNELYAKIGNLNRLLAWGHARVIENLLEKVPDCPRALSDQFAHESLIKRALMERGRRIVMEQRTKGESDIAVAAASILARDRFVRIMRDLSAESGMKLPKGASAAVKTAAGALMKKLGGREALGHYAKTHFKTYNELS